MKVTVTDMTPEEEQAVLALGADATVADWAQRHLDHQLDFALKEAQKRVIPVEALPLSPTDKATLDAIRAKYEAPAPPPPK